MFLLFDCITLNEPSPLAAPMPERKMLAIFHLESKSTWPRICQLCKESHAADAFSLWWVYLVISYNTNTAV